MKYTFIIVLEHRNEEYIASKIKSLFIKIDEINQLADKSDDVKYRSFNVDEPAIIEPFVKIEHKNCKQLIKLCIRSKKMHII